jgi:hypothetical protein
MRWILDLLLKGAGVLFGVFLGHKDDVSRDAGRAEQRADDTHAAVAAADRIEEAAAGPKGHDVTEKALNDGKF